jgi:hypothetical protein
VIIHRTNPDTRLGMGGVEYVCASCRSKYDTSAEAVSCAERDAVRRAVAECPSWDGYRSHKVTDGGSRLVVLVNAKEAGLSSDPEEKWMLICDTHGGLLSDTNKARLAGWMDAPVEWCEECRQAVAS